MGWVGAGGLQLLLNWSLDKGQKEPVADEGGEARQIRCGGLLL